jgi:hypothetical protein
VGYVNELVFSASLPRLYREAGYRALIANWDSSPDRRTNPELGYVPCAVLAGEDEPMPVVWHSQASSREFQDYIQGRNNMESFLAQLFSHVPTAGERAFPIYTSDWDVFDFQPWHTQPDGFGSPDRGEMDRIAGLLGTLKNNEDFEFVTPSYLLAHFPNRPLARIESSEYPLPYKKQELHSPARWAVCGRDSVRLNTQCNRLYQGLVAADSSLERSPATDGQRQEAETLWQELCYLWSSDFRTFTTEDKFSGFHNRMGAALDRVERLREALAPPETASAGLWVTNCSPVPAKVEPVCFVFSAAGAWADRQAYQLELNGQTVPCQVTDSIALGDNVSRLTLEAMPFLTPGQTASGSLRRVNGSYGNQTPSYRIDREHGIIETDTVRLHLLPECGGAIESLGFPQVFTHALVGLPSATGALSGDLFLEDQSGQTIDDHQPTILQYPDSSQNYEVLVPVRCAIETELGTIWKTYRVYLHQARVDLAYRFRWRDVVPTYFRLGRMVLNPGAFQRDSLYYATTNGGEEFERFDLPGRRVQQDEPAGDGVTGRGCLGATEGWVVLGDTTKGVGFVTRPAGLYSVPMVRYEETDGSPNFRLALTHSLGEPDETSHTLWRGQSTWSMTILGGARDIVEQARTSAALVNGGLIAGSTP